MSPHQIERERGLKGRGGVGADGVDEHLVSLVSPRSFPAEQYRALRFIVEQMHRDGALRVVAVTSPTPGDGKTTTAINLAGALAQAPNLRVLLVEADLRRASPTLADRLGLGSGGPGLVDAILNPASSLTDVVRLHPRFALSVLPAGQCPVAYYEILKSPRLGALLDEGRQQYDYVIVDTPPAIVIPDCRVISEWIDGFLIVVGAHKTPLRLVEETLKMVDPAKMLGVVFNGDDSPLSVYSGYGYGRYGYGRSHEDGRRRRWRWGRK
ncbi:MAG: CpsD/CapB family tyrosine-protein kinase [Candidatus Rokubacteria bacterium]|nr:CpsD/CapB family tyrosine-protein kinase [Candidatus Rokubacteria bacterium]